MRLIAAKSKIRNKVLVGLVVGENKMFSFALPWWTARLFGGLR